MRDWTAYVRRHLHLGELRGSRAERIVEELAGQLDDLYREARRAGATDEEAEQAAFRHVSDWEQFADRVREAERPNQVSDVERRRDAAVTRAWAHAIDDPPPRSVWQRLSDWWGTALGDVRISVRALGRWKVGTTVAVLTLALGLGATSAVVSVVHGVLVKPLPYDEPESLVSMIERVDDGFFSVAYPNFLDWRAGNRAFEAMAAYNRFDGLNLSGLGSPIRLDAIRMSATMFDVLRVSPALGRRLRAEDDRLGADRTAVLAHGFWQRQFGGDRGVIGRTVALDGLPYLIVGVMPAGFTFPLDTKPVDAFLPIEPFAKDWITSRGNHPGITVLARLRAGATIDQGRADMDRVAVAIEAAHPDTNAKSRVRVDSLMARTTRRSRTALLLLLLAAALLMLVACANVANLFLARATTRQRDMAIRAALGAGRARLVRLAVTESLLVWVAGGLVGLGVALAILRVMASAIEPLLPRAASHPLDPRVVGLALAASLVTGCGFGLVPAMRTIGARRHGSLGSGARHTAPVGHRLRDGLVVGEMALAIVLLVGATLSVVSFRNMRNADLGFQTTGLVTTRLDLPAARYADPIRRLAFYDALRERIAAIPGVAAVATTYVLPLQGGGWQNGYHVEGQPAAEPGRLPYAEVTAVSPGYFRTMSIPLPVGRDFDARDQPGSPPVVIVDQGFAARYWPNRNPIGQRLKFGSAASKAAWMEVVGVAGAIRIGGGDTEPRPQLYIPHAHDNDLGYAVVIRSGLPLATVARTVRRTVTALDAAQPVADVVAMDDHVRQTTRRRGVPAGLVTLFALVTLALAAVGVYGVMANVVGERTREMAVRSALGARSAQLLRMVVGQMMRRVVLGTAVGLAGALSLGAVTRSWLFGVSPFSPTVYALAAVFLASVALAATLVPALRAARVDVARSLQHE